jgi:hypothetical protein
MTTATAIADAAPRRALQVSPSNLQDASHFRTRWMALVPPGATIEDVQQPGFWLHVASKLKRMDGIEVLPEDEAWLAELLVLGTGNGSARVKVLRHTVIEEEVGNDPAVFSTRVEWGGPVHKHRVVRNSDSHVVSHGHSNKAEAMRAQIDYERALAA